MKIRPNLPPDQDNDGTPNSLDIGRDGDGTDNIDDAFPDDPARWLPDAAPTADAGTTQSVDEQTTVTLNGTDSSDGDGQSTRKSLNKSEVP